MAAASSPAERVVLVIGSTGNGKSTVCNILYDGDNLASHYFPENCLARGETMRFKVGKVRAGHLNLTIIDTVGIGDPNLSDEQVCMELALAVNACKGGIHQVFFVVPGRLSKSEQKAFSLMVTVLLNADVVKFTTIVRSKFPAFRKEAKVQEDLESMSKINGGEIYGAAAKVIHVDNPNEDSGGDWMERRRVSRERLLTRIAACSELYLPPELQAIQGSIAVFLHEEQAKANALEEATRLRAEIERLKSKGAAATETDRMLLAQLGEQQKRSDEMLAQMLHHSREMQIRMEQLLSQPVRDGGDDPFTFMARAVEGVGRVVTTGTSIVRAIKGDCTIA